MIGILKWSSLPIVLDHNYVEKASGLFHPPLTKLGRGLFTLSNFHKCCLSMTVIKVETHRVTLRLDLAFSGPLHCSSMGMYLQCHNIDNSTSLYIFPSFSSVRPLVHLSIALMQFPAHVWSPPHWQCPAPGADSGGRPRGPWPTRWSGGAPTDWPLTFFLW